MKKLFFAPLIVILLITAALVWFYINAQPVSGGRSFSNFVIAKGSSASQIGNKLQSAGFVKNGFAFKVYVQFTGQSAKLQAGEFRLSPSLSLFQTVDTLFKGPLEIWVTVPEGLRREEIADKFATALDKDSTFVDGFLQASKGEEGYLFPDTYLFPMDASASAIVNKMIGTFESKTSNLTVSGSNLSFKEAVTLASLLERETKTNEERPVVAGILIKRLEAGWPLQVDASVQYAVATTKCSVQGAKCDWWAPLTKDDLSINSPYNTYKFQRLPPSPIANPGLSSLQAAFNPTPSPYWYYIHDQDGKIHYAKTLEEHNANIAKYLGK